ncbi:UDP-N-acetylmuramoyl-L-alanyl-D-glutamate--2,6-diaminopimelate ligase [Consotaella aegiceratis]|uniref:UDP-N-acetylmuramoyl-L-alanyl-D-glutamate--2, 6-diaminopimelate ligase n=1 Tax=Consotaella aegiceratis TaxID=3097961 RepID=UPI002F415054
MRLSALSDGIAAPQPSADTEITGITADSRKVEPGYLFAALPGVKADGARFVAEAEAKGAAAILCGDTTQVESRLPVVRASDARRALALLAARFHGDRQPESVVAVTGTSGKTSITTFTRQIWAQAGIPAASIGTTGVVSPSKDIYGSLTTPDPVALSAVMAELADEGVTHAAMEASSHGIDQRRLDGIRLAAAAFSNLGRDHLDYHPTLDDYFQAKMRLFRSLLPKGAPAVVFADDAWSERAEEVIRAEGAEVLTVGRRGSFLKLKRLELQRRLQVGEIEADGRNFRVVLPLAGEFQMFNALVAAGLAIATGLDAEKALAALEHIKGASGRLDLAATTSDGVPIFVDYAHKPEALENVLASVRPFTTGRVIVVFGCGGDRDRGKRPIMGEIATRLADVAIVTDDNPRSEEPAAIRSEIMAAAKGAIEIGDRREAIRHAVAEAHAGDTVVVAGKGHENGQTIGTTTIPFSDDEEIRAAVSESGR